jgi:acyl-CoA thioester hydrolase
MLTYRTTCRVIYGDTDNMGQAYYANYFRWFEMGRNELFRSMGLAYASVENQGLFLPVAETYCKYFQPAKYDDLLIIETSLDPRLKGAIKFDYQIFSEDAQTLLAQGYSKHACLNRDGKVVRPPEFIKEIIEKNNQKS